VGRDAVQPAQKPTELLLAMIHRCPRGQENKTFFNCLFLNKLHKGAQHLALRGGHGATVIVGRKSGPVLGQIQQAGPDLVAAVSSTLAEPPRAGHG